MASVKWKGQEVQDPTMRKVVATLAILAAILGIIWMIIVFVVVIPLSIPVHFLLRLFGRRGFVKWAKDGRHFSYEVDFDGFRKQ